MTVLKAKSEGEMIGKRKTTGKIHTSLVKEDVQRVGVTKEAETG